MAESEKWSREEGEIIFRMNSSLELSELNSSPSCMVSLDCVFVVVQLLSHIGFLCVSVDYSLRLLCPWDFPGKNIGVGLPFPLPENLPDPGIEHTSPALAGGLLTTEPPGKSFRLCVCVCVCVCVYAC